MKSGKGESSFCLSLCAWLVYFSVFSDLGGGGVELPEFPLLDVESSREGLGRFVQQAQLAKLHLAPVQRGGGGERSKVEATREQANEQEQSTGERTSRESRQRNA